VATALIERNTTIPTRKSQVFSTATDNQSEVEIHVVQGERPMAADNKSLGKFTLDGIPPAPRGVPQIEVTFDIDADGILKVDATDQATGRSQHITVTASSGLTEDEVERMTQEAEQYAEQDRHRRELAEAVNAADNAIYASEKALREIADSAPPEEVTWVKAKIEAVKEALDHKQTEPLTSATNDLLEALQDLGASVQEDTGSIGSRESDEPDEDVVDAEFKDES
jgi:molecular chaperone DnaK